MGVTAVAANTRIRQRDQILSGAGAEVPSTVIASGGTVTISGSVVTHTFTTTGRFDVYQGGYVTVTPTGGSSTTATTGTLAAASYVVTIVGGAAVTFDYSTDGLLAGLYATGGTIAVNGNNIEHTFSAGGSFTLAKKGLITVSWVISATGTFDGSGASGGPADKVATCAVTVTSGTVVVSYAPGAFLPGNPLGFTQVKAFFDASKTSTITDTGGLVDNWASRVGTIDAVGSGATRPTTNASTLNTRNVIDFAADYLTCDERLDFLHTPRTPDTPSVVLLVGKIASSGSGATYGFFGDNAAASANIGYTIFYDDAAALVDVITNYIFRGVGGSFVVVNASANGAFPATTWTLLEVYSEPETGTAANRSKIYVANGAAIQNNASTAAASASASSFFPQIGATGNNAFPLTGSMAALVVADADITGTDRTLIRTFLGVFWGVTF